MERLHRLAVQYLTTILCVIHVNPGSENGKTRGHLGSQLARKAESNIELSKDAGEVTTVYTSSSRHAFISKQDGPRFKWDSLAAMHVSCVPETKERNEATRGVLSDLVNEIFNIPDYNGGLAWEDVHKRIEKLEGLKREALESASTNFVKQSSFTEPQSDFGPNEYVYVLRPFTSFLRPRNVLRPYVPAPIYR